MKKEIAEKTIPLETTFSKTIFKPSFFLWTLFFSFSAILAPILLAHIPQNQLLVGTIVNASLFGAVWQVGWLGAFWVAVLPSTVALIKGTLPLPMATLIPFIIFSNLILVFVFHLLPKKNLLSIFLSASLKFIFLFSINLFFTGKISAIFLKMLSWPQLITALAGGLLIWIIKESKTTVQKNFKRHSNSEKNNS